MITRCSARVQGLVRSRITRPCTQLCTFTSGTLSPQSRLLGRSLPSSLRLPNDMPRWSRSAALGMRWMGSTPNNLPPTPPSTPEIPAPDGRLLLAFTCKRCNHRSHKTFSKTAYETGVVIIQCDGCESRHLIADNKGWFRDGRVTIEDLVQERGGQIQGEEALETANPEELEKLRQAVDSWKDREKKKSEDGDEKIAGKE